MYQIDKVRLVWRKVDEEMVVLDLEEATYFTLNDTGSLIWLALAEGGDSRLAAEQVSRRFKVDAKTAERDTAEYIQKLTSAGLIRASAAENAN